MVKSYLRHSLEELTRIFSAVIQFDDPGLEHLLGVGPPRLAVVVMPVLLKQLSLPFRFGRPDFLLEFAPLHRLSPLLLHLGEQSRVHFGDRPPSEAAPAAIAVAAGQRSFNSRIMTRLLQKEIYGERERERWRGLEER